MPVLQRYSSVLAHRAQIEDMAVILHNLLSVSSASVRLHGPSGIPLWTHPAAVQPTTVWESMIRTSQAAYMHSIVHTYSMELFWHAQYLSRAGLMSLSLAATRSHAHHIFF